MTDQARAIVHDAEQQWCEPRAGRGQHLARAVVEVQVPQGGDMLDLEAAHLALFQAIARRQGARGIALGVAAAHHPVRLQIAPYARIGRHRGGAAGECRGQVVVVQLSGPTGMVVVLRLQGLAGDGQQTREGTAVGAHAMAQHRHRIGRGARGVVPALEGRDAEAYVETRDRMAPGLGSEFGQGRLQFPARRRGGQQGADDGEAQAGPTLAVRDLDGGGHQRVSRDGARGFRHLRDQPSGALGRLREASFA